MNRIFLLLLGCLASISFAQTDSIKVEDWTFSHAAVSIEGGEVYPFGDLVDAVYNTYYGGFGFRYSYWENVDGVVMFHYSYFEPRPKEVVYDGVHQFMGKVGLDWRFKVIEPVVLGGGFACNWTRADYEEKEKPGFNEPGGTLTDNETEFGWYARMKVDIVKLEKYRVGLNVMWEEIWTLPKRSDMLYAGFYIERSLW
jgi:hypothetical protein